MALMTRPRTWLAGLMLACCPLAFALNPALDVSQYAHSSWKVRDGFFKGTINDIAQTPDGYLWLATGFGLLRFDGVRIVPWEPPADQPLPSDQISRLLVARDGTLWIGTRNGLASWKDGKLTQYTELAGLSLFGLLEDREGSIWAGAFGFPSGKVCEIQNGAVRCHPEIDHLDQGVFGLHKDGKGNLWIGLMTGVWRWKPGPPEFYPISGQRNGIQGMADGDDGGLLISTANGVMRLAEGKVRMAYPFPDASRGFEALKMRRDRDGGLWVGTGGRGIVHIHQGRTDAFSQSDGLSADHILGFFEDREGSMWVSTIDGLDRFRELPVTTYSVNEGLSEAPNGAILGAKDGSVWVTTADGIDRLNHGQITVYRSRVAHPLAGVREIAVAGLPEHGLESLFEDSSGRIWISTPAGIGYLDSGQFISTAVPSTMVHGIAEDRTGDRWIADQNLGLFRWSPSHEVQRTLWPAFGSNAHATALATDPADGGLWLGFSKGGIAYFRGGRVLASFSAGDGLGSGRVNQLRFDRQGALWAATEGGLSRLKDGRISTLTRKNGLPCHATQWSIEDEAQSVWLNTPCGLVRVARSDLDDWVAAADKAGRSIRTTVFDTADGVRSSPSAGGFTPHVAKSPDGRLWFWTPDGVAVLDPGHLPFNKLPPPVHIEQVIGDRKPYEASSNLRLPPLSRDLEIDYTALSLVAPEKIRFKYKLEGRDLDWQDAGNRRQAFYSDLAPRNYRFRVTASNNSGVWNEAGASFDFSVAPAYYQSSWFRAACGFTLLALLWGLYRYRLRQVAREFNLRMEERVAERGRMARDLHDTLLQGFQGLMLRLQAVDDMLPQGEPKQELEQTLDRADQVIAEGRKAVHDLRSSTMVGNDLARAVRALGDELFSEDSTTFDFVLEGRSQELHPIVRDEVYRITRKALRNAFSHARAHHIEAELIYSERLLRLRIRDDGEGIAPAILEDGRPGHFGLPGMRERAAQIGAKLDIWSGVGTGTEIELNVPGSIAYAKQPRRSGWPLFPKEGGTKP